MESRPSGSPGGLPAEHLQALLDRGDLPAIREVRQRYLPMPGAPASTAVQVAGLVEPDLLVEFTPVALIPHKRFKQPKR